MQKLIKMTLLGVISQHVQGQLLLPPQILKQVTDEAPNSVSATTGHTPTNITFSPCTEPGDQGLDNFKLDLSKSKIVGENTIHWEGSIANDAHISHMIIDFTLNGAKIWEHNIA